MLTDSLSLLTEKIEQQRSEFCQRLVSFVASDTILFLPECLSAQKYVLEANQLLKTSFGMCFGCFIADENLSQSDKIETYLESCSDFKIALLYLTATEIRSVLLAILFTERRISAQEVFECAFFEELMQQKKWGETEEVSVRHEDIKQKLNQLEKIRDERSLY